VHLVNFLIYVASLACFEFLLTALIANRNSRDQETMRDETAGVAGSAMWILGYSLFIATSILMTRLLFSTPDTLVAAVVYVASGLILRIRHGQKDSRTFVILGIVLGIGYLSKPVMLPLGFLFLATALFAAGISRESIKRIGLATVVFSALATPFITLISLKKGHLTFGEVGLWNYSFWVNRDGYWTGNSPGSRRQMRMLVVHPPIYEFTRPVAGTFPPWYDPMYWREGIKPHFTVEGEFHAIKNAIGLYNFVFLRLLLNFTAGLMVLYAIGRSLRSSLRVAARAWTFYLPAGGTLLLYALVHVEPRMIGADAVLLFLAGYSGIILPSNIRLQKLADFTLHAIPATALALIVISVVHTFRTEPGPVYQTAALELAHLGVDSGDQIGLIWNEKYDEGAGEGAFIPRLVKARVVAEQTDADFFWRLNDHERTEALNSFKFAGVKVVLGYEVPPSAQSGWKRLRDTSYFAYFL
jgi:hypothetical protein